MLKFKKKVQELSIENNVLKMRVRKGEGDLARKQKAIKDFIEHPSRCASSLALSSNKNLHQEPVINNLQIKLFKVIQNL